MEVIAKAGNVIRVRVAQEEAIDVEPALLVAVQPVFQIARHIGGFVIPVVCCGANVDIDQKCLPVIQPDKGHVAVANGKKVREEAMRNPTVFEFRSRACLQLSRIIAAAKCTPARKFLASLS
jgi:hypothetical protein